MPDDDTQQPSDTDEQQTHDQADDQQQSDTDWQSEADKWKSLARKHEERAKANADAATRLAEIEDAQKTEQQKLTEAAEAAQKRATQAESELMRMRVAVKHELPAALADRLKGDTEDELEQDAQRLLELVGTQKKQPDLKQGVRSGDAPADGNAWLRQMASR